MSHKLLEEYRNNNTSTTIPIYIKCLIEKKRPKENQYFRQDKKSIYYVKGKFWNV